MLNKDASCTGRINAGWNKLFRAHSYVNCRYSVSQILQYIASSVLKVVRELEIEVFQVVTQPERSKEHKAIKHFKKGKINDRSLKKNLEKPVTRSMNVLWQDKEADWVSQQKPLRIPELHNVEICQGISLFNNFNKIWLSKICRFKSSNESLALFQFLFSNLWLGKLKINKIIVTFKNFEKNASGNCLMCQNKYWEMEQSSRVHF